MIESCLSRRAHFRACQWNATIKTVAGARPRTPHPRDTNREVKDWLIQRYGNVHRGGSINTGGNAGAAASGRVSAVAKSPTALFAEIFPRVGPMVEAQRYLHLLQLHRTLPEYFRQKTQSLRLKAHVRQIPRASLKFMDTLRDRQEAQNGHVRRRPHHINARPRRRRGTADEVENRQEHVLLIAPTVGQNLLAKHGRCLNVPFAIGDATTLTEAATVARCGNLRSNSAKRGL